MKAIDRIKKLNKDEIIHLIESKGSAAGDLIESLRINRIAQRKHDEKSPIGACFECKHIAIKLGIEK